MGMANIAIMRGSSKMAWPWKANSITSVKLWISFLWACQKLHQDLWRSYNKNASPLHERLKNLHWVLSHKVGVYIELGSPPRKKTAECVRVAICVFVPPGWFGLVLIDPSIGINFPQPLRIPMCYVHMCTHVVHMCTHVLNMPLCPYCPPSFFSPMPRHRGNGRFCYSI